MARRRSPLRNPTGPWDFLLGLLALVSLGIFLLPFLANVGVHVPQGWERLIIPTDIGICVVFGADYLIRMGRSGKGLGFARENLLQPFAAIPLNTPVLGDIQLVLYLILFSRFIRAFNVVFGQEAFQGILHRYSGVLARELSDAVLIRSLATAREVTRRGRFAKSVADALDRRRGELSVIVGDAFTRVPGWETVRKIPGAEDIVKRGEGMVIDATLETLRSERLNILIANIIDDTLEDFKRALDEKHPGLAVDALGPASEGRSLYAYDRRMPEEVAPPR